MGALPLSPALTDLRLLVVSCSFEEVSFGFVFAASSSAASSASSKRRFADFADFAASVFVAEALVAPSFVAYPDPPASAFANRFCSRLCCLFS